LGRRREEMRRTAIETAAGEWGRSGGEAAPAFGGGDGVECGGRGKKRGGFWITAAAGGGWSRATMICFSRGFPRDKDKALGFWLQLGPLSSTTPP